MKSCGDCGHAFAHFDTCDHFVPKPVPDWYNPDTMRPIGSGVGHASDCSCGGCVGSCPCLYTEPCHKMCSCRWGGYSRGCERCASYGSYKQRVAMSEWLARLTEPPHRTGAGG